LYIDLFKYSNTFKTFKHIQNHSKHSNAFRTFKTFKHIQNIQKHSSKHSKTFQTFKTFKRSKHSNHSKHSKHSKYQFQQSQDFGDKWRLAFSEGIENEKMKLRVVKPSLAPNSPFGDDANNDADRLGGEGRDRDRKIDRESRER